jgi:predicted ATP-dependent serine protease
MEMKHWKQSRLESEQAEDRIDPSRICTFGIKPLDDALIGLLPNDLAIIGADSGVGKSEICLDLAIHNASKGKKVALYFIEGENRRRCGASDGSRSHRNIIKISMVVLIWITGNGAPVN